MGAQESRLRQGIDWKPGCLKGLQGRLTRIYHTLLEKKNITATMPGTWDVQVEAEAQLWIAGQDPRRAGAYRQGCAEASPVGKLAQ